MSDTKEHPLTEVPYAQALEKVRSEEVKSNLAILYFQGTKLVLPHADALVIMEHLRYAECYNESYGKETSITPMPDSWVHMRLLSQKQYEDIKVAGLLNIKVDEVTKIRLAIESFEKKDDPAA